MQQQRGKLLLKSLHSSNEEVIFLSCVGIEGCISSVKPGRGLQSHEKIQLNFRPNKIQLNRGWKYEIVR